LFGAKKYCINDGCIYHYFDIRKNDEKIKDKKQLLSFIKNREREIKLKRIIN
jgi:ureidoglycolate hydrolase